MLIRIFDWLLAAYGILYFGLFFTDYSFLPISVSNISAPTIGFAVLLSLRYVINKESFLRSPLAKQIRKFAELSDKRLLCEIFFLIFVVLLALSEMRHLSFSSSASDLGIFDQAIWNASQGRPLYSSLKDMNLLGDHFEPILFLIAPLYKIWPNVAVLFILQSFLLASAVFPLYLIAKNKLGNRLVIFAFIISYALSRPLRGVGLSDFHPESFIVPLLFWAYYFLITKKNWLLLLSIFLLLLCKEDVTFIISAIGIFAFFSLKRHKLGIGLFSLGIAMWLIETKFIIAFFNPSGEYPYMNRLPFGATYADNLKAIINNPALVAKLFINIPKLEYIIKIFAPLGFLSLLSAANYILIAVPLIRNLLPANLSFSGHYNISSHYVANIIPFVYISAVYGAAWLLSRHSNKKTGLAIATVITLSSLFFYGKTDGYKLAKFAQGVRENQSLKKLSYLKLVPIDASLATNFNIVPHLSHRDYIFEWNPRSETSYLAEYIAVDMNLLGYIPKYDWGLIEPYFEEISKKGYKLVFLSPEKSFLIFHNVLK